MKLTTIALALAALAVGTAASAQKIIPIKLSADGCETNATGHIRVQVSGSEATIRAESDGEFTEDCEIATVSIIASPAGSVSAGTQMSLAWAADIASFPRCEMTKNGVFLATLAGQNGTVSDTITTTATYEIRCEGDTEQGTNGSTRAIEVTVA